jgi:lysophospholipase L1-like esterase
MKRLDRVIRLTLLAVALASLLLALAEAIARRTLEAPVAPYEIHSLYRATRTPGYKQTKISIEPPHEPFLYEIDALGFRGKAMQTVKKPAGTYRIFFLGASTTENQHLPEEKTFPGLVEATLGARFQGNPRVEVANCGIAGYGVARSLSLLAHRVLALEPDLVVVLEGENDLMVSLDDRWDPTNGTPDADHLRFKDWLVGQSRLLSVLSARTGNREADTRPFLATRRQDAHETPYFVPEGLALDRGLATYKAYLGWIALLCEDAQVPLVLMTQPTLWKENQPKDEEAALWMSCFPNGKTHLDPATCARLMAKYNDATRDVATSRGAILVDLAAIVPKDLEHLYDDAHMTARGNDAVAAAIVAAIAKDGTLPGKNAWPKR